MSTPPTTLRERKRSEVWLSLHDAAAELALSHDNLHDVTIEAIVARANVSPRTFFNYFGSKEEAVLGVRAPSDDAPALADFALSDHEDVLDQVTHLLFDVSTSTFSPQTRHRRKAVIQRYPELRQRHLVHVTQVEDVVRRVVADRLAGSPRFQSKSTQVTAEHAAQILVMVGGAALKFSIRELISAQAPADERKALDHALAILREVIPNI